MTSRATRALALAVATAFMAACGSTYTSMRQLDDGSYLLTENAEGFWRVAGHVYRCTRRATSSCVRKYRPTDEPLWPLRSILQLIRCQ